MKAKRSEISANEYQKKAHKTACYGKNTYYPILALVEEAGELQGTLAKFIRKHDGLEPNIHGTRAMAYAIREALENERQPKGKRNKFIPPTELLVMVEADSDEFKKKFRKELGDVLWNCAEIASAMGWKLGDVMQDNLDKLAERKAKKVLVGSGESVAERKANAEAEKRRSEEARKRVLQKIAKCKQM